MSETDLVARLDTAVAALTRHAAAVKTADGSAFAPRVAVVLGSGLGAFGDTVAERGRKIPYAELGFPSSAVVGHAGALCLGTVETDGVSVPIACMQGRVHAYEGHEPDRVVFAVRALARWGCRTFVLTNAAGGVNPALEPGDLMLLSDHLNLMGWNPLSGPNDDTLGARFVDMTVAYDRELRDKARGGRARFWVVLREGVYAALSGAELRDSGGDSHAACARCRRRRDVDGPRGDRAPPSWRALRRGCPASPTRARACQKDSSRTPRSRRSPTGPGPRSWASSTRLVAGR